MQVVDRTGPTGSCFLAIVLVVLSPLASFPPERSAARTIAAQGVVASVPSDVGTHPPTAAERFAGPARSPIGFGTTVMLAGEELFVGRPGEIGYFPMPPAQAGAVYLFRPAEDGSWSEVAAIQGAGVEPGDAFGEALGGAGELLVVGAPATNEERGAAYVFRRNADGGWSQEARLELADAAAPGDRLGSAVTIAAGSVAVGAPGTAGSRGAVHLFARDADTGDWGLASSLEPGSNQNGSRFGAALAAAEERLFIGAPGPAGPPGFLETPPAQSPGAAFVYARTEDGWRQEARLTGRAAGDETAGFGYRLLPAGEGLFVAAPTSARFAGRVHEFRREGTEWRARATLAPPTATGAVFFGGGLALADSDLLVGAPLDAGGTGRVHVFRRADDGWTHIQALQVPAKGLSTALGSALAASGDLAVVGAPAADFFEGRAIVYVRDSATDRWTEATSVVEKDGGLEAVTGDRVECEGGTAAVFPCEEVDLVAFLPVSAVGGERGVMLNDLWGWTDPETGREYAIVGRFDGTAFVDVTEPTAPVYLGELPLHEGAQPNLWRDMKVYANHVFVVADGAGPHGMQVFDLTRLRDVGEAPVTFTEDAHYDRIHSAHNLVVNPETGFAYAVGASMGGETCGGALHMVDIRDPRSPTFAGCFADPATGNARTGYTHDAQCVVYRGPDGDYGGREICFNASETALGIADVTDKVSPVAVSHAAYPNVGYAHQGWLSDDHRFFFLDDELDELSGGTERTRTLVWDVSDLDDPVLVTEHLGTTRATDHNLYVRGGYMYQSNYVSGLRILDVGDPANPVEVGWFDTVPFGEDVPGFAGSWSNYPFFESGIVVVTSMREGLFILRKREPRAVS